MPNLKGILYKKFSNRHIAKTTANLLKCDGARVGLKLSITTFVKVFSNCVLKIYCCNNSKRLMIYYRT